MSDISLPADLYSPDQLSATIMELRAYLGQQRNAVAQAKSKGVAVEVPAVSVLLAGVMHKAKVSPADAAACEKLLPRLEALRAKAPVAHITLADLPSRSLKRKLTEWFRHEIHPTLLLTFAVRSDIGGGIVVQTGSRLYDFSFRRHILGQRAKIGEIFDRVRK